MKVRLTRKHADRIDGVDLTGCQVGDVVDLAPPDGRIITMIWGMTPEEHIAERARRQAERRRAPSELAPENMGR